MIRLVALCWVLFLGATLLVGCGAKPAPEVRIVTQRVEVPIRVPCVPNRGTAPAYAADSVPLDATIFELVRALLQDRLQRQARDIELNGALDACQ
jgi:hypothetical protein